MKDKRGKTLSKKEIVGKITHRLFTILSELDTYCLHLIGGLPFHIVRRFLYRFDGLKIGSGSTIHMGARFYAIKNISIGEDTIVGENVVLDGRAKLVIGNHVDIASEVMIYNAEHDIHDPDFVSIIAPVAIGDYVFIGPRAIILPGISLGTGAVVAAGAVVTKDVEPFSIVGGIPAKVIGERKNKELHYILGRAAWFR